MSSLLDQEMYFGAIAASERMLNYFDDQESHNVLYESIIKVVDKGYPYSVLHLFVPSQTSLGGKRYASTYNTYKAIISVQRNMKKWAADYLSKVDDENYPRYIFFNATAEYAKGNLDKALELYGDILKKGHPEVPKSLLKKSARNVARIYFEKKAYKKAIDIYSNFLLKLNPVEPSDWIEAAWAYLQAEQPEKALGYLYNLESHSSGDKVYFDKYVIRALAYVSQCDIANVAQLSREFSGEFGKAVLGVKLGHSLTKMSLWKSVYHPGTLEYSQYVDSIKRLKGEALGIQQLDADLRPIAKELYRSEVQKLRLKARMHREKAVQLLARELINIYEGLKFLRFQAVREKYSPLRIFSEQETEGHIEDVGEQFRIRWPQYGDYWRDERLIFQAKTENRCL